MRGQSLAHANFEWSDDTMTTQTNREYFSITISFALKTAINHSDRVREKTFTPIISMPIIKPVIEPSIFNST
jgi:hypothetical protein